METSREDTQAEIQFQNELITEMKRRRRELELQMARFGDLYTPPHITREITELTNQIISREQELVQLETQAVEGQLPLAEVEYQALVAEAWSRSSGWLSTVDQARLELDRLRLRITQDKSNDHHNTVRHQLAIETLLDLELNDIQGNPEIRSRAVQRIIRAFRFDSESSEDTLHLNIDSKSAGILAEWIETTKTVWRNKQELNDLRALFQRLLENKQDRRIQPETLNKVPQTWIGQYTYINNQRSIPMIFHIEKLEKRDFIAKLEWRTQCNTITRVSGQIIDNLTINSEVNKWRNISHLQMNDDSIAIKFTETDYIQGGGTQLHGFYYGIIQERDKIIGVWFSSPSVKNPGGEFTLQLAPK